MDVDGEFGWSIPYGFLLIMEHVDVCLKMSIAIKFAIKPINFPR